MSSTVSYINDAHHAGYCKFDGNKGLLLLLVFASLLALLMKKYVLRKSCLSSATENRTAVCIFFCSSVFFQRFNSAVMVLSVRGEGLG